MPNPWRRAALIATAAALMALAQAPISQPAGLILGLTLVFTLNPRGFWTGWLLGLIYFALTLSWIIEPFFIEAPRHGWMAPFAITFMAGGLALFWGAAFWLSPKLASLLAKISRGSPQGGGSAPTTSQPTPTLGGPEAERSQKHTLGEALILATVWALAEFARANILTGFPWANFAQSLMDTPAAWLLPLAGPNGVVLVLLLCVALWSKTPRMICWGGAVAIAAAATLLPGPTSPPKEIAPLVRVVQPNAPQDQKWEPSYVPIFFDRMRSLTAEAPQPALTVWPEMAVPYDLYAPNTATDLIAETGSGVVVTGSPHISEWGYHNSLVALQNGQRVGQYDKTHLVPFGEYLPFPQTVAAFGLGPLATANVGNYTPGTDPKAVLDLPGIGLARPLICYEGIFPEEVRQGPRPRVLILVTNDAWFGTITGPYQHLVQARMRALELGVPLLRSANTGVSAIIDARGNVVASIPLGQQGQVSALLPAALPPTPYARFGELIFICLTLTILVVITLAHRRRTAS